MADAGSTVKVFDGTTQVATTTVSSTGSWSTNVALASGSNSLTAQDTDAAGNTGTSNTVVYTLNTTVPVVTSITTSGAGITNGVGDLNAGKLVTLTVTFSEAVNVTGSPTLSLNDGGSASYNNGSGTSALTFNYTVAASQNTSVFTADLAEYPSGSEHPGCGIEQCRCVGRDQLHPGRAFADRHHRSRGDDQQHGRADQPGQQAQMLTGTVDMADAGLDREGVRRHDAGRRRRRSPRPRQLEYQCRLGKRLQ